MKKLSLIGAVCTWLFFSATTSNAVIITDGDFLSSSWVFGSWNIGGGTATTTQEATGGNPDARLSISTATVGSGVIAYGTAVKTDFSTSLQLEGADFTLELDVLSGAGAYGAGQGVLLLVEQNSSLYRKYIGDTGVLSAWDTFSFTDTFSSSSFSLISGPGPANPDFSGGTSTIFGFGAGNANSFPITQYYDNFSLEIPSVPVPPAIWLFGSGLIGLVGMSRRNKAA